MVTLLNLSIAAVVVFFMFVIIGVGLFYDLGQSEDIAVSKLTCST